MESFHRVQYGSGEFVWGKEIEHIVLLLMYGSYSKWCLISCSGTFYFQLPQE